jgi:hypothetical protein
VRRVFATLALTVCACAAQPNNVVVPADNGADAGKRIVDAVIAIANGDQVVSCLDGLPVCGTMPKQGGPCASNPILGPNDGNAFMLDNLGRIEVGFLCSFILDGGIKIWSTVPPGKQAVIEVSKNGSEYVQLDILDTSDKTSTLQRIGWSDARFVRITDTAGGGIAIDAIEGL